MAASGDLASYEAHWDQKVATIVTATTACLRPMRARGHGRVVSVGSMTALKAEKGAAGLRHGECCAAALDRVARRRDQARGHHRELRPAADHRHTRESSRDAQGRSNPMGDRGKSRRRRDLPFQR
jgi:hypothetical protein